MLPASGSMRPTSPLPRFVLALVSGLAVHAASSGALALERQLLGGPRLGFAGATGPAGGLGGLLELHGGYGLNDAFHLYATTGYQLLSATDAPGARHGVHLSAGLAYAFDYLRVTPLVSLGARGNLVFSPRGDWLAPAAEARLGLVWHLERYRHLEIDLTYAAALTQRDLSADLVQITVGLRFLRDL